MPLIRPTPQPHEGPCRLYALQALSSHRAGIVAAWELRLRNEPDQVPTPPPSASTLGAWLEKARGLEERSGTAPILTAPLPPDSVEQIRALLLGEEVAAEVLRPLPRPKNLPWPCVRRELNCIFHELIHLHLEAGIRSGARSAHAS
jgi:hypothetical protein